MAGKKGKRWHILADPFAAEEDWLAACNSGSVPLARRAPAVGLLTYLVGLLLGLGFAYGACAFVHLGYDLGYRLVELSAGQPSPQAANQGWVAIMSMPALIFPSFLGLFLGLQKRRLGGSRRWYAALALLVLATFALAFADQRSSDLKEAGGHLLCLLSAVCSAFACFAAGDKLYGEIARRLNPARILLPALLYLIPSTIYALLSAAEILALPFSCAQEIALYILLLAVPTALASRLTRARTVGSALAVAAIGSLPIQLANLFNVAGNLVSLSLDTVNLGANLGWRALLSAVIIILLSASATAAGAILGRCLVRQTLAK